MKARSAAVAAVAAGVAIAVTGCGSASPSGGSTTTVPAAAQQPAAPVGSGHGLCFDLNSQLAQSAIATLPAPDVGQWQVGQASDDPISAGCDGVLSWMTVSSTVNHPFTNVLLFTGGAYLGTATSKPYMFTQVTGKTRNTVSVTYHWLQGNEAMCCPTGGPSVVTLTLNGTKVTASGQFPPHT